MARMTEAECKRSGDLYEAHNAGELAAMCARLEAEVRALRASEAELKAYKAALVESRPHHDKLLDDLVKAEAKVSTLTDEVVELKKHLERVLAWQDPRQAKADRAAAAKYLRGLLEET